MANVTLSATSAAGKNITYSANALPTGVSINGANVSGTPTTSGTTYSLITATAATTNRTATRNFTWVVSLSNDTYFKNTTLLLNGEGTSASNGSNNNIFIDSSNNNYVITRAGNATQGSFNPYSVTGWSNYFDGTGDYLTVPDSSVLQLGSGDFTVEFWINYNSITGYQTPYSKGYTAAGDMLLQTGNGNGALVVYLSGSAVITESTGANIGQWYHYALVRSGTTVTLYRDGVSRGTATSSVNFNTTNQLAIGATGKAPTGGSIGMYSINGYMSNFRLVKGTAVYTSAFTPATTPLTAISGTQLLTCQSNRFIDNGSNNFTITKNGDTSVQAFSPFLPSAVYTSSLHGGSAYFDGTGDYLTTPNISPWQFGTGDFTVEFWVYPKGNGTIVGLTTSGAGTGYWNAIVSSGNFYWASGLVFRGTADIDYTNAWHHFAYVRSSGTSKLYIDGTNLSSGADSTNYNATVGTLTIGSGDSYGTMAGYISDLRITKGTAIYTSNFVPPTQTLTAITNTGLLLNFTNAGIIDQHGSNVLETVGNVQVSTSVKKYNNASIYQDGSASYLSTPLNTSIILASTDFTIEGWFYFTSWISMNAIYNTGSIYEYLGVRSTGTSIEWSTVNGQNRYAVSLSLNTWYHIAATRSGSTLRMFLNGTSLTVGEQNTIGTDAIMSTTPLKIGYYTNASYGLNGYIDDFRITKGYARYTANFTAPTSALITK
jgi:hypothetical protein